MKKLKFLALGLVAAFGFAACGDDEETVFGEKAQLGGSNCATIGSFWTYDNGAQTKEQLGETGANVIFAFSTTDPDNFKFISGTDAKNTIVNSTASVTKFLEIKNLTPEGFDELSFDNAATQISIDKKLAKGRRAVAFFNEKCQGFFEILSFDEESEIAEIRVWKKDDAKIRIE